MLLALLILALPLLPVSHLCQLLLPPHLLLSLDPPDLLEDVDLGLLDQLLLQFDLVLLPSAPLFMREGVVCAVTDLGPLLEDAGAPSTTKGGVLAPGNVRLIDEEGGVAPGLGGCKGEAVEDALVVLILFVSIVFLGRCSALLFVNLNYGLLFVPIDEALDVLILLFEFFLDFDIDELGVVNADGASFGLLPHYLINEVDGLLGEFDKLYGFLIIHIGMNHLDEVGESWRGVHVSWRAIAGPTDTLHNTFRESCADPRFLAALNFLPLLHNAEVVFWDDSLLLGYGNFHSPLLSVFLFLLLRFTISSNQ